MPKFEVPDIGKMVNQSFANSPVMKMVEALANGKPLPSINNIQVPSFEIPKIEIPTIRINNPATAMNTSNFNPVNNQPISIKNEFTFNGETKGITKADIAQTVNQQFTKNASQLRQAVKSDMIKDLRAGGIVSQSMSKYRK
jgi:hypothetical protein